MKAHMRYSVYNWNWAIGPRRHCADIIIPLPFWGTRTCLYQTATYVHLEVYHHFSLFSLFSRAAVHQLATEATFQMAGARAQAGSRRSPKTPRALHCLQLALSHGVKHSDAAAAMNGGHQQQQPATLLEKKRVRNAMQCITSHPLSCSLFCSLCCRCWVQFPPQLASTLQLPQIPCQGPRSAYTCPLTTPHPQ
jgi:hypothetical protein